MVDKNPLEVLVQASQLSLNDDEKIRDYLCRIGTAFGMELNWLVPIVEKAYYGYENFESETAEFQRVVAQIEEKTTRNLVSSGISNLVESHPGYSVTLSSEVPSVNLNDKTSDSSVGLFNKGTIWRAVLATITLQIGTSTLLGGIFITKATLYWDNRANFSIFRDVLHSANFFGELPWWHPGIQSGFPFYYLWMLAVNGTTPLYSSLVAGVWSLGKLGLVIGAYREIYAVYFVYIVPILFTLSILYLLTRIFSQKVIVAYGIVLISASPGIVFTLSDIGLLEQTTYGMLFAGSFLHYLTSSSRKTLASLVLSLVFLSASLNHLALYWNVLFIPAFVGVVFFISPPRPFPKPTRSWLMFLIALIPAISVLCAYLDGGDLIRTTIGQRTYDLWLLGPGNPIEPLLSSTPGIGIGHGSGGWQATAIGRFLPHAGYIYLGITTMPLAVIGLIWGREPWRLRLFVLLVLFSVIVPLASFSPYFIPLLASVSPLQAVGHYGDTAFRAGGFILWIMTACLGLEALVNRKRQGYIFGFVALVIISMGVATRIFVALYPDTWSGSPILGFYLAIGLFSLIALWGWLGASLSKTSVPWMLLFLAIVLLDATTVSHWHVRNVIWPRLETVEEAVPTEVSFETKNQVAQTLLTPRHLIEFEDRGVQFEELNEVWIYPKLKVGDLTDGISAIRRSIPPTLVVDRIPVGGESLLSVNHASAATVTMTHQTYNKTEFLVTTPEPAAIFWRDIHFPGWSVIINGHEGEVLHAFHAFKGAVVPSGQSTVEFVFKRNLSSLALFASYITQLIFFLYWLSLVRPRKLKD